MDPLVDKAAWRGWARQQRGADVDAGPLLAHLARFLSDHGRGWILTYRALPVEVDPRPLEAWPGLGPFALTRTPPASAGRDLTVHPAGSPSERHPWGFDQPVGDAPEVALSDVGAVLVPGLVFDQRGARLGHGAGYYDRLLARLPAGALRIGVAPVARVVERLPAEPHDVAMTHLATELGVAPCAVSGP